MYNPSTKSDYNSKQHEIFELYMLKYHLSFDKWNDIKRYYHAYLKQASKDSIKSNGFAKIDDLN